MSHIALTSIRTDGGTQPRARLDQDQISEYVEAMEAGATFPPLVVFHDGAAYWLADGFHRYHAVAKRGAKRVAVEIRQGTQRDAILYSSGANATHGLPRSNADKRRAVERLLRDEEWRSKSDRWIAEKCAVSDKTVAAVRAELRISAVDREGKDGKTRKRAERKPREKPDSKPPEEEYEERFDADVQVLKVINAVRNIAANWPDDVDLRPLVEALRKEAERLEERKVRLAA